MEGGVKETEVCVCLETAVPGLPSAASAATALTQNEIFDVEQRDGTK